LLAGGGGIGFWERWEAWEGKCGGGLRGLGFFLL
jgi:hypothetical protein